MKMKYNPEEKYFPLTYANIDPSWTKAKIISIVLALIAMSVAAILLILEIDRCIAIAFGGFGFMMFGVYTIKSTVCDYPEERFNSAGLFIMGALVLAVSLFIWFTNRFNIFPHEDEGYLKAVFTSIFFFAGGSYGLIYEKIISELKKNRCTECVTATCIDVACTSSGRSRMYVHVWEYFTGSFTYTTPESRMYMSKKNHIGDIRDIYVNPDDPEDIYVNRFHRRNIVYIFFTVLGAFMTAVCFTVH